MYDLTEIKARINCIDYCRSNGISIAKPGDRTISPFHNSKNKTSFVCYADSWYSFSDGMGGDVIDLCAILKHNGDKGKAINELAKIAGVAPAHDTDEWRNYMQEFGNRIFYYNTQLTESDYDYLHSRGISDDTIKSIRIGRNEEGRLVVPYWRNGAPVYFASRSMPGCKYEDVKYKKMKIDDYNDNCPWGLDTLTREGKPLIIAEGMFDALSAYQQGYPVLSAITGHFSQRQLPEVLNACRQFDKVVLTYDTDPVTHAGEKFTVKMAKILYRNHIPFDIAPMPFGCHDLSEYHASGQLISSLVHAAQDGIGYLCRAMPNYDELRKFVLDIARSTPVDKLSLYLSKTDYDNSVIKELIKIAKDCPRERFIAEEILQQHELMYVPSDSFYEWDEHIWKRLTEWDVKAYVSNTYGKQFATANREKQMYEHLKTLTASQTDLNRNHVVSFTNGTFDLETCDFREFRKTDYVSMQLNYNYDAEAKCPTWERFIDDITCGNAQRAELLQQIAGYVLFPDCRFQKIFVMIGKGSNGKSVYLDTLEMLFGTDNCTHIDPADLPDAFQRIHLKNSYLNFATEISNDFAKAENILKQLSDGTTIQACYKGKDHIKFQPRAKLVFACNEMPKTRTIQGMERRMHFIDFPMRFVDYPNPDNPMERQRDYTLQSRIAEELPGIFNWAIAGYLSLMQFGEFTESQEQASYIAEFRRASSPVEIFAEEYAHTFNGTRPLDSVYADYCDWAEKNGHNKSASNTFSRQLKNACPYVSTARKMVDGQKKTVFIFNNSQFVEIVDM